MFLNIYNTKKMIPFAFAVLHDCTEELGLNLEHLVIPGYNSILTYSNTRSTIIIPKDNITAFKYSADLEIYYQRLWRYIGFERKDKYVLIMKTLLRFLLYEQGGLSIRSKVSLSWRGSRDRFIGSCELLIGPLKGFYSDDYNMIVSFPPEEKNVNQSTSYVLTQAACLLKTRLSKGLMAPILAVLTDCIEFRFFVIDADGLVFGSQFFKLSLDERDSTSEYSKKEWQSILEYFQWFLDLSRRFSSSLEKERLSAIDELRAQCPRLL
jgi:hypothetical protein